MIGVCCRGVPIHPNLKRERLFPFTLTLLREVYLVPTMIVYSLESGRKIISYTVVESFL